ncbi:helix-turn-helix domain-containing protein [Parasedimentitalea psychrophila]|uniref:Helix-turn-helix domain-containing protein n=1 Tax=Parasedimentitalea psychrophila TaxID=2997337 RepID=A0A9Y2KYX8_9RHOB|nr:helix-turn-helix domain-containing protein [Parasedimentitalea psychrophila]WIY23734.1 helix-turn-helix domain-containing protein [Parasedimentitalea psychrophila]
MRGLAEHLGDSKSALYHYFPTKGALFLATQHHIGGLTLGGFSRSRDSVIVSADEQKSSKEYLDSRWLQHSQFGKLHRALSCLY